MADYVGVLADLRARMTALQQELAELDTAIGAIERLAKRVVDASAGTPKAQADVRGLGPRAFASLTMPQAIEKYMKAVQQPQTIRQIQDGLLAGGMKAGKNMRGHVYNTLHRLSQDDAGSKFRREGDSRWSLREWQTAGSNSQGATGAAAH